MGTDTWDPAQYDRFAAERAQPFRDLLALVEPSPGARVVDLGCGTGRLTADLHRHVGAAETIGVDRSAAMLADADAFAGDGLSFVEGDLADWGEPGAFDVVFANASFQWVPDHDVLFRRAAGLLREGGQLAVQMPSNFDHPTHVIADSLGQEYGLPPLARAEAVFPPVRYAVLLDELGFLRQHVRLQIYGHHLDSTADVIEWVKGTLLTRYRDQLGDRYPDFLAEYRSRLLTALGDPSGTRPYFFPFPRLLLWARR